LFKCHIFYLEECKYINGEEEIRTKKGAQDILTKRETRNPNLTFPFASHWVPVRFNFLPIYWINSEHIHNLG